MNQSNKDEQAQRRANAAELRKTHEGLFKAMGLVDPVYFPKCFYVPKEKTDDVERLSFWESELKQGKDIYTERSTKMNLSEDVNRTLYKWTYNKYWETEYEQVPQNPDKPTSTRYYIPADELTVVPKEVAPEPKPEVATKVRLSFNDLMDPNHDAPLEQMTMMDVAAIIWKKPVSNKAFLNAAIIKQG